MIYKRTHLLLAFLLPASICFAQQKKDSIHHLSLQQSIAYAVDHQGNVINARYEVDKASAKLREIIGIGLPQVSASANVQDFLQIPTTLIPASFFGGPPGTFEGVKFGTQYNTTGEIDASQLIFDGSYIVGLEATKTYKELSQKSLIQTTIQTVSSVTKAYYTILVNHWKLQMVDADVQRLKALMDQSQAMYEKGFAEKIDWERIKVSYNNLKTQETTIGKLVGLSYQLLKFQMGMPLSDSLTLSDSLKSIPLSPDMEKDTTFRPENRIEYSQAQTNLVGQELLLRKDNYSYFPSLAAYASVSRQALGNQFEIFSSSQTWYPTSLIGLKLSVPIFDGLQKSNRVQQDKISVLEAQNTLNTVRQSIYLDLANSSTNLQNALSDLRNQQENMDLAQNVEHDAKIKYEAGTGSNIEVIDAETSLTESESNYYNALFNALVAKVDYEQAKGNLYNKK
ncbi:MAG TPA: TolC family protein [Bacteroidia bacterium]|jgi:outer membrane protein|nr:TolC family protein [Bacteroidia bacterium]